MKKLLEFARRNSLTVVSAVALFVGTLAVVPTSIFSTYQPECPKELLK
jgi:cyclic lactone autoinducer peptide